MRAAGAWFIQMQYEYTRTRHTICLLLLPLSMPIQSTRLHFGYIAAAAVAVAAVHASHMKTLRYAALVYVCSVYSSSLSVCLCVICDSEPARYDGRFVGCLVGALSSFRLKNGSGLHAFSHYYLKYNIAVFCKYKKTNNKNSNKMRSSIIQNMNFEYCL